VARKNDIPSLATVPISPQGASGKSGDLTDMLLLGRDPIAVAELAPEIAPRADRLVTDGADDGEHPDRSFFATCAKRIRQFIDGRRERRK
jgi:hypothetical protein